MPTNPFWEFSTRVYQRDSVQRCLLELQDRHGADINILLGCCWLASGGAGLEPRQLQLMLDSSSQWQLACIQPIRAARRFLKGQSETLYKQAQALELAVERSYQDILWDCLGGESALSDAAAADDMAGLALRNVTAYVESICLDTEALQVPLEQLIATIDFT